LDRADGFNQGHLLLGQIQVGAIVAFRFFRFGQGQEKQGNFSRFRQ
jgi:hypothetical protein